MLLKSFGRKSQKKTRLFPTNHSMMMVIPTNDLIPTNEMNGLNGNHMGVSKNRGTPKSSILIGFPLINHPFWGTTIFGNTHMFQLDFHQQHMENIPTSLTIFFDPLPSCRETPFGLVQKRWVRHQVGHFR